MYVFFFVCLFVFGQRIRFLKIQDAALWGSKMFTLVKLRILLKLKFHKLALINYKWSKVSKNQFSNF